ncbi:DUF6636 domain-containing protein [Cellulomonas sp. HZM]|uniref:DUF6636 domain-containing protein n=1 Tax=Cellulomonas sp. HZM TaxID=1454010 RepID=UPI0004935C07|nr:DUF6636 domain-containing protein [Cellulomonas sp. HZM]
MTWTRTTRTWLVVDVVLVLLLVVIAVTTSGGGSPQGQGPSGPPSTSTPGAPATTGASGTADGPTQFGLPSRNIGCVMQDDGVTCTIASYTYSQPKANGCDGERGHVMALHGSDVSFPCQSSSTTTRAVATDVPVLEYGMSANAGDYTCTSATDGVTCVNGKGDGFRLSRASWEKVGNAT